MREFERGMEVVANPETSDGRALIDKMQMTGVREDAELQIVTIEDGEETPVDPHGTRTEIGSRIINVSLPMGCEILRFPEGAFKLPES
jgi:hypothetical protein